jgi:hypothetical protein
VVWGLGRGELDGAGEHHLAVADFDAKLGLAAELEQELTDAADQSHRADEVRRRRLAPPQQLRLGLLVAGIVSLAHRPNS